MLGAELAIRSCRWRDRGLWWGVSGLGLSQILASWLGQGSYYALLALGGYVAYRTILSPPENHRGRSTARLDIAQINDHLHRFRPRPLGRMHQRVIRIIHVYPLISVVLVT